MCGLFLFGTWKVIIAFSKTFKMTWTNGKFPAIKINTKLNNTKIYCTNHQLTNNYLPKSPASVGRTPCLILLIVYCIYYCWIPSPVLFSTSPNVTPEKRLDVKRYIALMSRLGCRTVEDGIGEAAARQGCNAKNVIFLVNTVPPVDMEIWYGKYSIICKVSCMLGGGWKLEIPSVKLTAKATENTASQKETIVFQPSIFRGELLAAADAGDYRNGDPKNVGVRLQ